MFVDERIRRVLGMTQCSPKPVVYDHAQAPFLFLFYFIVGLLTIVVKKTIMEWKYAVNGKCVFTYVIHCRLDGLRTSNGRNGHENE